MSAGARFRAALEAERPLQIVGTINAYTALLAERAGHKAIYLSGAGVANASFGLPDLAITTLNDVCEDIRRIASATDLPLLVDADTGWGSALMIARTIREMTWAGAAACHIEDQVMPKRCGHLDGKEIVPTEIMVQRLKAAAEAKEYGAAIEKFEAAFDLYPDPGLTFLVGESFQLWGNDAQAAGNSDTATQYYKKSVEAYEKFVEQGGSLLIDG